MNVDIVNVDNPKLAKEYLKECNKFNSYMYELASIVKSCEKSYTIRLLRDEKDLSVRLKKLTEKNWELEERILQEM